MDTHDARSNDASATCRSRRGVLAGAGALALATAALRMRSVLAEDGTPVATPVAEDSEPQSWLFVQTFTAGSWEPTDVADAFALHLSGGLVSTIGFTDRPYRDFSLIETDLLLPRLFTPDNPPNAAIVVEVDGVQYTFILVLTDPVYDHAADTITYTASVLEAYEGEGLGPAIARVADGTLPTSFGAGAIFIDSLGCKDSEKGCKRFRYDGAPCTMDGYLEESLQVTNTCASNRRCYLPCDRTFYDTWCNETFPDWCFAYSSRGCVFALSIVYYCED